MCPRYAEKFTLFAEYTGSSKFKSEVTEIPLNHQSEATSASLHAFSRTCNRGARAMTSLSGHSARFSVFKGETLFTW